MKINLLAIMMTTIGFFSSFNVRADVPVTDLPVGKTRLHGTYFSSYFTYRKYVMQASGSCPNHELACRPDPSVAYCYMRAILPFNVYYFDQGTDLGLKEVERLPDSWLKLFFEKPEVGGVELLCKEPGRPINLSDVQQAVGEVVSVYLNN